MEEVDKFWGINILTLDKVNETYITLRGDAGAAQSINEYLRFRAPNFQYHPSYKARFWDGYIRLFDWRTQQVYYGLLPYVEKHLKDKGIEYQCNVPRADPVSQEQFAKFIKQLDLPDDTKLRDYQLKAVLYLIRNRRGALLSPTRSGKTLVQYTIQKWYNQKTLIIVPTVGLVDQMYDDFVSFGEDPNAIHRIVAGEDKQTDKRIVISVYKGIYKLPKKYFKQYRVVFGDECHGFTAKSLRGIMEKCVDTEYRFGLTGTLDAKKVHRLIIEGLFGSVHEFTTTKKLIESKHLAPVEIKTVILHYRQGSYAPPTKKRLPAQRYHAELKFCRENLARQKFLTHLINSLPGNVLCLFRYISHGKQIYEDITNTSSKPVFYCSGETRRDARQQIRTDIKDLAESVTCASYRTFSEGVDIPRLNTIVLAHPTIARIRLLQSIGRALTPHETKEHATVIDIIDDVGDSCYGLKHFRERMIVYNQQGFDVKHYDVQLEK